MSNKIICNSCGLEMYQAEAINTKIGNLCAGCNNLFLDYYKNFTKKQMKLSILMHLIPSILFFMLYLGDDLERFMDSAFTFIFFLLFLGGAGAYNIVKNGFVEVGDTVRKNYYKATFSSNDQVSISDQSYDTYSGEQWLKIFFNIIIFAIGIALTLVLGPLVFLFRLFNMNAANRRYNKKNNSNLGSSEKKVSTDTFDAYQGLIAQKALDIKNENTSIIAGVEMQHFGYLYYENKLYAAIGTQEKNSEFEEGILHFIKLYPKNNNYDIVSVTSNLYRELFKEFND